MEFYAASLSEYKRLPTREVKIGDLLLGNFHPIRVQTMQTADGSLLALGIQGINTQ